MKAFEVLDEVLRYRLDRYLNWPVDWRDFPIFKSKIFDPTKWKNNFNWGTDVAGIYAHKPPFTAAVNIVTITPFGVIRKKNLTCETAGELHKKTRQKVDYSGCSSAMAYTVKWGGSRRTQSLLNAAVVADMEQFSVAFWTALGYNPVKALLNTVPLYYETEKVFDGPFSTFQVLPKLKVKLTFPLEKSLPGHKLVDHIEVVK
jgi:hypothetical protein